MFSGWNGLDNHNAIFIQRYNAIAHGGGSFVTAGNAGKIGFSTDNGTTWASASVTPPITVPVVSVIFDGSRFFSLSQDGYIYQDSSSSGNSWSSFAGPINIGTVNALAYGNVPDYGPRYVVTGSGSANIVWSSDASGWTAAPNPFPGNNFLCIAYGNGIFVAGDGGGYFIAVGDNGKMAWADENNPKSWNVIDAFAAFGTSNINAVAYRNGTFVAGGGGGKIACWRP